MESVSRAFCHKNVVDCLLILLWEARREKFLLKEFHPEELGGFMV